MDYTVILPLALHVCENWCVTVTAKRTLSMHKNRLLTRTFGCNRGGATHHLFSE